MHDTVLSPMGQLLQRRDFLGQLGTGLAGIALASLLGETRANEPIRPRIDPATPLAPRLPHAPARAKRVLHIYCAGAVSQVDTFDYKPELIRRHGTPMPGGDRVITHLGGQGNLIQSLWPFRQRGKCGKYVSDLLPRLGELVDDLCFVHSMTARASSHGPGEAQLNTGFTMGGFPSMGAWVSYALGTEQQNLPAFVAIPDPRGTPQIGSACWSNGFLPAVFQGTAFSADRPIANLHRPPTVSESADRDSLEFLRRLNEHHLQQHADDAGLRARISSYELAARLQVSATEACDLGRETRQIHDMYGTTNSNPLLAGFARNCLLAKRLLERDVRFVQVFNGAHAQLAGRLNWDSHNTLEDDYNRHGPILDQPAAALIVDLKQRGMLDDTLVLWSTEFGRMPTFQARFVGRDHNPQGFTVFFAGAGVKKGFSYGATDEFGFRAVENVATIYDFHATMLHLLGLDHERLSYYHNGIERRLTDVHGHVLNAILG